MSFYLQMILCLILYFVLGCVVDAIWLACNWASDPESRGSFYPTSGTTKWTHIINIVLWPLAFFIMIAVTVAVFSKCGISRLAGVISSGLMKLIAWEEKKKKDISHTD